MFSFFLTWFLTAVALFLTAAIVPGIAIASFSVAIVAAVVLGLINAIVKPILVFFTLPLTLLTLGLFLFVINAIALMLTAYFTRGFQVNSFFDALFGSIILSIISGVLNSLFVPER
jgi:putative membrane protein